MSSAADRRQQTLRILKDRGQISVSNLSELLQVSEATVRKDLRHLEDEMLLTRTYGGAILANHNVYDRPFAEKAKQHAEEKYRIGQAAADLVEDNDTIILDSGSTTLQLARHLRGKRHLVTITNSVHIVQELLGMPDVEIILLGGIVRSTAASAVGPFAEEMLKQHSVRRLFLAGDGLDVDYGLTTTNPLEASLNRRMIQAAQETIVVIDSSKFGRRGLSRICGLESIDRIITDDHISDKVLAGLREADIVVQVV